jgi:long-subunit acyl-CoA synthetase (AMP-forming)
VESAALQLEIATVVVEVIAGTLVVRGYYKLEEATAKTTAAWVEAGD